jgi:sugar lactone lactonase YvrE
MSAFDINAIGFVGSGIARPECVLATSADDLYVSDRRGAFTRIDRDGRQTLFGAGLTCFGKPLLVNGIELLPDGSALLTQLDDPGGVWRFTADGALTPFLLEVDGAPLPATNFVHADAQGRVWATISTRAQPRTLARTPKRADGFIVMTDRRGARIVADGLSFTNEAKVDPSGRWLYVTQTYGRKLNRFAIQANGDLGAPETIASFGEGIFPDGLTFDAEGGVWITSPYSNSLVHVDRDGHQTLMFDDIDRTFIEDIERQYRAGELTRSAMPTKIPAHILGNISSMAFGGPDMRTGFIGSLLDHRIATVTLPVPGAHPPHWNVRFGS